MAKWAIPGLLAALLFLTTTAASPAATSTSRHRPGAWSRSAAATSAAAVIMRVPRLPLRGAASHRLKPTSPRLTASPATASADAIFNGLNHPGLNVNDNSFQTAPPDSTGSIGLNHYVETVNSVIGVYHKNDLSLLTEASFNTWLAVSPSLPLCDPQIQWDQSSQRWLYVVLECDFGLDKLLFGWSKTPDPSDLINGWCRFSKSTPGVLPDYPKLGHSSKYMLIGVNSFSDLSTNPFVTAQIFWMKTPAPGVSSCTAPTVNSIGSAGFPLKNGDGTSLTATPVPVNTTTNAPDGYVVSAYDPSGPPATPQTKLAVFHVDGSGIFQADNDITVNTYAVPAAAPDLGGSSFKIDTLDGRLTQAVGDPSTGIYTQHTVNGAGGRSKVTWYEIQVISSIPTLVQEGDIAGSDFVFNGAISPRSDGQGAVIFYNRSSATTDPVIATQGRMVWTPAGQMDPGEIILATSTSGDSDFSCNFTHHSDPCRWGDYAGASPDPVNTNVVWGSNQALTTPGGAGFPNWFTQNFAIVGPVARPASQSSPVPTTARPPALTGPAPGTPGAR